MANKIKLENIVDAGFDSGNGDAFLNIIEKYVCGKCRHIVEKTDKYCWKCGELLVDSGKLEHYYKGEQLTDTQFKEELEQFGD